MRWRRSFFVSMLVTSTLLLSIAACDLSYLGPGTGSQSDAGDASSASDASSGSDASPSDAATANCGTFGYPPASSFADDFSGSTAAPNWNDLGGCMQRGTKEISAMPPSHSTTYCLYQTAGVYHLTCDSVTVKVPVVPASQVGVQTVIYLTSGTAGQTTLLLENGEFTLGLETGTASSAGPYDVTQDVWWRLREHGGELSFETSADGVNWLPHGSLPDPMSLDAVAISIGAGEYKALANPGEATFRCYNRPPPCE